jgi:signal peptidase II
LAIAAATAAVADVVSKLVAMAWLSEAPSGLVVTTFFNLRTSFNSGISFSLFSAATPAGVLALVALAAVLVIALVVVGLRAIGLVERMGYGLIVGGAIGNAIDRARDGVVTDFLDFHAFGWHWPSFNVADVAIVGGVFLLLASPVTVFRGLQRGATSTPRES